MPTPRCFHIQAGEYHEKAKARSDQRVGKVVSFVRANPLSTSDEIFQATGYGPMVAVKYIKQVKYNGQICWRINRSKCP